MGRFIINKMKWYKTFELENIEYFSKNVKNIKMIKIIYVGKY